MSSLLPALTVVMRSHDRRVTLECLLFSLGNTYETGLLLDMWPWFTGLYIHGTRVGVASFPSVQYGYIVRASLLCQHIQTEIHSAANYFS